MITPVSEVTLGGITTTTWIEVNPTTGQLSGVLPNGVRSGGIGSQAGTEVAETPQISFLARVGLQLKKANDILQQIQNYLAQWKNLAAWKAIGKFVTAGGTLGALLKELHATGVAIVLGFLYAVISLLRDLGDPPVLPVLSDINLPFPEESNSATSQQAFVPGLPTGTVAGDVHSANVVVAGQLNASWSSSATGAFLLTTASSAIRNDHGRLGGDHVRGRVAIGLNAGRRRHLRRGSVRC